MWRETVRAGELVTRWSVSSNNSKPLQQGFRCSSDTTSCNMKQNHLNKSSWKASLEGNKQKDWMRVNLWAWLDSWVVPVCCGCTNPSSLGHRDLSCGHPIQSVSFCTKACVSTCSLTSLLREYRKACKAWQQWSSAVSEWYHSGEPWTSRSMQHISRRRCLEHVFCLANFWSEKAMHSSTLIPKGLNLLEWDNSNVTPWRPNLLKADRCCSALEAPATKNNSKLMLFLAFLESYRVWDCICSPVLLTFVQFQCFLMHFPSRMAWRLRILRHIIV